MSSYTLTLGAGNVPVSKILDMVDQHGLCILPEFVKGAKLEALNREFETILSPPPLEGVVPIELNEGRAANIHLYELRDVLPKAQDFFRSQWMQEASNVYWEGPAKLNDNIYVMEEVPGTEHVAQDLHFDVQETFKFFLYLNDVTSENGAFSCVPGSHRHTKELRNELGDEISYEKRELTREHPFSESDVVPIEGKAGTLIVFTTEVWHRAGKVSRDSRRVMRGHTRKIEEAPASPGKKVGRSKRTKKKSPSRPNLLKSIVRKFLGRG